jgi:hypothetical protein
LPLFINSQCQLRRHIASLHQQLVPAQAGCCLEIANLVKV